MSQGAMSQRSRASLMGEGVMRVSSNSLEDTLSLLTGAARDAIDGVEFASVSLTYGAGQRSSLGATDPIVLKADALQAELGEGPMVEALDAVIVHSEDVGSDPRWPSYGRRAIELGVKAQTSVRLRENAHVVGTLNLYSTSVRPLDDPSSTVALLFAAQATTAVSFASRVETLTKAIANRQDISQAIGIIMERHGLDESHAFAHLVNVSQTTQVKLRVIARDLIERANTRRPGQS
ncbi:MAG: GAF and ANTAR domain-containing protein [Propionibacteriales bacterium]|nr:GAF and ANTAR domain-containing protein [Propionibacteriales bacterium]